MFVLAAHQAPVNDQVALAADRHDASRAGHQLGAVRLVRVHLLVEGVCFGLELLDPGLEAVALGVAGGVVGEPVGRLLEPVDLGGQLREARGLGVGRGLGLALDAPELPGHVPRGLEDGVDPAPAVAELAPRALQLLGGEIAEELDVADQHAPLVLGREQVLLDGPAGGLVRLQADEPRAGGCRGHEALLQLVADPAGGRRVSGLVPHLVPDVELPAAVRRGRERLELVERQAVVARLREDFRGDGAEAQPPLHRLDR